MRIRKIFGKVHLWLGLTSGLIVFISILPASIFVWDEELTNWWYADYVYVEPKETKLPLSELLQIAQNEFPKKEVLWMDIHNNPNKSYIFQTYKQAENPGLTFFSELEYWNEIYVNPYSGEVLGVVDIRYDWIYLCRMIHQQLLLNYEIGHWPVAIATLIIFVMLFSGIVLWWPRNINAIKQRFTIKWKNVRWRRKNYDLHNVGGFYTTFFIFILASTGLVWSFTWWTNGIYRILGDNPKEVFQNEKHIIPSLTLFESTNALDNVLINLIHHKPNAQLFSISIDKDENRNLKEYSAWITYDEKSLWEESDYLFFHPNTGEIIHKVTHGDKSLGEKWRNSNYAIHVGSIWGVPTKIVASMVSLICAFLPISGFLIWYGRRKKRKLNSNNTRSLQRGK
jgi:uncharacterized iron-regulated membrane protein